MRMAHAEADAAGRVRHFDPCNREAIRSLTSRIQIWDKDRDKWTRKNAVTKA